MLDGFLHSRMTGGSAEKLLGKETLGNHGFSLVASTIIAVDAPVLACPDGIQPLCSKLKRAILNLDASHAGTPQSHDLPTGDGGVNAVTIWPIIPGTMLLVLGLNDEAYCLFQRLPELGILGQPIGFSQCHGGNALIIHTVTLTIGEVTVLAHFSNQPFHRLIHWLLVLAGLIVLDPPTEVTEYGKGGGGKIMVFLATVPVHAPATIPLLVTGKPVKGARNCLFGILVAPKALKHLLAHFWVTKEIGFLINRLGFQQEPGGKIHSRQVHGDTRVRPRQFGEIWLVVE